MYTPFRANLHTVTIRNVVAESAPLSLTPPTFTNSAHLRGGLLFFYSFSSCRIYSFSSYLRALHHANRPSDSRIWLSLHIKKTVARDGVPNCTLSHTTVILLLLLYSNCYLCTICYVYPSNVLFPQ